MKDSSLKGVTYFIKSIRKVSDRLDDLFTSSSNHLRYNYRWSRCFASFSIYINFRNHLFSYVKSFGLFLTNFKFENIFAAAVFNLTELFFLSFSFTRYSWIQILFNNPSIVFFIPLGPSVRFRIFLRVCSGPAICHRAFVMAEWHRGVRNPLI